MNQFILISGMTYVSWNVFCYTIGDAKLHFWWIVYIILLWPFCCGSSFTGIYWKNRTKYSDFQLRCHTSLLNSLRYFLHSENSQTYSTSSYLHILDWIFLILNMGSQGIFVSKLIKARKTFLKLWQEEWRNKISK